MIGIFDSGIGGLTVAKEIIRRFPKYDIIYFGDTARAPYGDKSPDLIKQYTKENIDWLISQGAKIVVVACHSSSIIARDIILHEKRVPVFEMVSSTVKLALSSTRNGRIGVLGTRATVNSGQYENFILAQAHKSENYSEPEIKLRQPAFSRRAATKKQKEIAVFSQAAPLLVPLVEEGWLDKPETKRILKSYLRPLKLKHIDTLLLACTHYPLLKKLIKPRIGKQVKVIDPGQEVARELEFFLKKNQDLNISLPRTRKRLFYVSDISQHFLEIASRWLGADINLLEKKNSI